MRAVSHFSAVSLSFALAACAAEPAIGGDVAASAEPSTAQTSAPGATDANGSFAKKLFGAPITEKTDTSLADLATSPANYADKTVRTTGKVVAVCKKAGCWMEIGDDASRAHIKMAGHGFFVPKTSDGHTAIVQGTVKPGAPQNECGSKDSCGGEDNGALAKVEIVATGVEFVD
jgi:starvation-inducible outer membrane lipoprotein